MAAAPKIIRECDGMKRRLVILAVGLLVGVVVLAACGDDDPSKKAKQGAELFSTTFDNPGDWEESTYPPGAEQPDSTLAIVDGRYQVEHRAVQDHSFAWGVGGDAYENVIIEVEAEQLSNFKDNLYGVACRVAANEDGELTGYALLISGDGHYGIASIDKTKLSAAPFLSFLLEWHQSDEIKQGQAQNTIRVVCVDDYLAIYVNDKFLGEVKDDTYSRAGQIGLIGGTKRDGDISITFDNLSVYEGTFGE
jgi:hypothetical protein